jgi:hypothetical protein
MRRFTLSGPSFLLFLFAAGAALAQLPAPLTPDAPPLTAPGEREALPAVLSSCRTVPRW